MKGTIRQGPFKVKGSRTCYSRSDYEHPVE